MITSDDINVSAYPETVFSDSYTVSEKTITVSFSSACKVGYLLDDKYIMLEANDNEDGTYSFTAPDDVDEVILVMAGDTNLSGSLSNADSTKLKASIMGNTSPDTIAKFAADINGDSKLQNSDVVKIKAILKGATTAEW